MIRSSIIVCGLGSLLLALAGGCDKAADEQQKAVNAQTTANDKIIQANQEADQKATSAQADADKKIAAAQASFLKMREDYRHETTTNLVDLDKKISELEAKEKTATGKKKADLDVQLGQIRAQREAFASDWKSIETASATSWDATKSRLDKEWADLKGMVDRAV